jgi:hypothetical protein
MKPAIHMTFMHLGSSKWLIKSTRVIQQYSEISAAVSGAE